MENDNIFEFDNEKFHIIDIEENQIEIDYFSDLELTLNNDLEDYQIEKEEVKEDFTLPLHFQF